jgi:Xaa-Pro aminopeptidase
MVVSNEPGYYEVGNFGIRIENLLYIVKKTEFGEFAGKEFLGFARLTQIPIQKTLIKKELLSQAEIEWVNSYHQEVYDKVFSLLQTDRARQWLTAAVQPL